MGRTLARLLRGPLGALLAAAALLTACGPEVLTHSAVPRTAQGAKTSQPMTVLVPLYSAPGPIWNQLVSTKAQYPGTAVTAVVNPDTGPGTAASSAYIAGIAQLRAAGITVAGYVHTSYGARPAADVVADITDWVGWYGVTTIFLDEMASAPGEETYYAQLRSSAQAAGAFTTIGNPGTTIASSYAGCADVFVVYENAGYPTLATLAANDEFGRGAVGYIADDTNFDKRFVGASSAYAGYVFATDQTGGIPYSGLPSYLAALLAAAGA